MFKALLLPALLLSPAYLRIDKDHVHYGKTCFYTEHGQPQRRTVKACRLLSKRARHGRRR